MAKETKITAKMEQDYLQEANSYGEKKIDYTNVISEDELAKMRRPTVVRNKILIKTRSKNDPNPDIRKYIDICFYDEETKKIVGEERIPKFYRELYGKHIIGKKNSILYAEIDDIKVIKEMLKKEKEFENQSVKRGKEFLADLDKVLK